MLNVNINYPYPVLREYEEDYQNTIFEGNLAVRLDTDGYLVHPAFDINNEGIKELIQEEILTYALEVQCASTWFRRLYPIKDNTIIKIDAQTIHERVELIPCIIASKSLEAFSNSDFAEEYKGMTFDIKAGDVLGIGGKRVFDALYQNDIIKNGSSIVNIEGSKTAKEIVCNYSGSVIKITLPEAQYNNYINCGYNRSKYKMLNAILIIPVLVEAIGIIQMDENDPEHTSGFESCAWYKTIVANLKRYAENDEIKYTKLLEKPFSSAELLLGNNSAAALDFLCQIN